MNYPIRRAGAADIELLARFNRAMALESEDKPLELARITAGLRHLFAHPQEGHYLVAQSDNGIPVGALLVTYEWSDWRNGRFWWIQSVYVLPEHRRSGVYRALHQHVREAARQSPEVCGLRLYVERENRGAQATYLATGMSETHYRIFEEEFDRD